MTSGQIISETKPYEVALTPAENNSNVVPPFNAFSPAGDVTVSTDSVHVKNQSE